MIKVEGLSKHFGQFCAVNDISFSVQPGEVLGFLGPNGAGKSTTMKMLTGFLTPSSGVISLAGHNVIAQPVAAQKILGYLPEGAPAYSDMTARASLEFVGKVRGFVGQELKQKIAEVAEQVALESVLDKRVETLSKGYRRRLGLAQAIIHDPKVLILDEPTDGLDPNQKHQVRKLIKNLAEDKIVIVSTHILEEVTAVCTRAMILSSGKILFDGTPEQLAAKSDYHNAVNVRSEDLNSELLVQLEALELVTEVERVSDTQIMIKPVAGASVLADVNKILHANAVAIDALHVEAGRLDDVFRTLTLGGEQSL
jgi:ABC-2 type transport system ATP-binding protein